ncbi:methyltransferase [bacterium]|nr:methyltransferase [candidate division CSSED10-310 bacterium]
MIEFIGDHIKSFRTGVDLGCGVGIVALALAANHPGRRMLGVDIQPGLIETAIENARRNELEHAVTFNCGDLRDPEVLPEPGSIDLVAANPPFRKLDTGKISPVKERSIACHETSASLSDYIRSSASILRHKGYLALTILPERLAELIDLMNRNSIRPTLIRFIHHRSDLPANGALVLGRRNGKAGLRILSPLIVLENQRLYRL